MNDISTLLLDWYDQHARVLPWRPAPGGRDRIDPYRTWVSETMLQQTRVETVLGYYARFLARFPTLADLAAAPADDVLKLWEGLGYYSRARNLHAGARQVMADFGGVLPSEVDKLRAIRGIGPYTAGAIASIAYGVPVPAVDGNVIRVVSRLRGIRENVGIPSVRRQLEGEADSLVPAFRPGDFNQALMDLGATVCTPGTPDCEHCPLRTCCDAYAAGDADELPILPRKSPPKTLHYAVALICREGAVLMRQRTEAMLKGMWVFPLIEAGEGPGVRKAADAIRTALRLDVRHVQKAGEAKHVFTHQIWQMTLFTMDTQDEAPAGYRFVPLAELDALAIPTAMKIPLSTVKKQSEIDK